MTREDQPVSNLGYLSIVKTKDSSSVCVTPKGNSITVPAGCIPPSADYVDSVAVGTTSPPSSTQGAS